MAFESLGDKLKGVFNKLTGRGTLSEKDIKEAMRQVRLALLEADVNYKVTKEFVAKVSEKAMGAEVMKSLTPGQQVIKIVQQELTELMGGQHAKLKVASKLPTVIVLCGLQGAGKTTFAAKLGAYLKKQGKNPMLAACDTVRLAAVDQLKTLGEQTGIPVHSGGGTDPVKIVKQAKKAAEDGMYDTLIVDTAGRLHIDEEMMQQIQGVCSAVTPTEVLLVVDAMTGQDAVNIAKSFDETVPLTGIVLTKLDGDARGGAALSMRAITGKPIKFAGTGEKIENIEPFHPERMASRILGMGDVLTLIEKAQETFDLEEAAKMEQKLRRAEFTLQDFLDQMQQVQKMGSPDELAAMLPGVSARDMGDPEEAKKHLKRTEAIIYSMTPQERRRPEILNASRRKRIAAGSGVKVSDVNRMLNEFESIRKLIKQFTGNKRMKKRGFKGMKLPF
ncbi:MAG: signal recognition particle protein [Clostridiales bacterium]|nr:signal recognition particle protein [Clostridiales bacterium]